MAKKAGAVQLQQEINTDEEWDKFLQKPGLLLIDIFSEWSGPCSAMAPNLKKAKLEPGGDVLQFGIAKCDTISYLERFRYSSEPTWMFIAEGKMVNLMFGVNAPKLARIISEEIKKEAAVKEGTAERQAVEISELSAEESVRYEIAKKIQDEIIRIQIEKEAQMLRDRRVAVANVVLDHCGIVGVILVFPHAVDQVIAVLAELWEPAGLAIAATEKSTLTEEMMEELLYFTDITFTDIDLDSLLNGKSTAILVKPYDADLFTGDMESALAKFIYNSTSPPGIAESPAQVLMAHVPIPKEVPQESATALRSGEPSLGKLPSMPSLSAFKMPSSTRHSKEMSKRSLDSKGELRSKTDVGSKQEVNSKTDMSSKTKVRSKSQIASRTSFKEDEETIEITGLWTPPNIFTTATAIKLMFPKIYDPIALPEPVPIPPHIAIAFDAVRRKEILELMQEYPDDIMRHGFFTSDDPETAKLIGKTRVKYEKAKQPGEDNKEKIVIQISRKRSEAWCFFSQQSPTFMSHTVEDGEEQCKLFFPEGYDEPEEEEVVVEVKKKKGKKGKQDQQDQKEEAAEVPEEEEEGEEEGEEEEEEGDEEGEEEGEEDEGEEEQQEDDMLATLGIAPVE